VGLGIIKEGLLTPLPEGDLDEKVIPLVITEPVYVAEPPMTTSYVALILLKNNDKSMPFDVINVIGGAFPTLLSLGEKLFDISLLTSFIFFVVALILPVLEALYGCSNEVRDIPFDLIFDILFNKIIK
jgi:hypothetical protein